MKNVLIVAPEPMYGSGGVNRIYSYAQFLCEMNINCDVLAFNSVKNVEELSFLSKKYHGVDKVQIYSGNEIPANYDLIIATMWTTAKFVKEANALHKAYLVQDYEAWFNQLGDGFIMAENTYSYGFHVFTYGRWLASELSRSFNAKVSNCEFGSNPEKFYPIKQAEKTAFKKVCFIYQFDKPRRCPVLGLEALEIVKSVMPDVEIVLVGSEHEPDIPFEVTNLGILSSDELNLLYNECTVGFCISSSNPSCNAFDMMYSGLPCVELYRETNLYDMTDDSILLSHSTPESLASAILTLLVDNDLNKKMSDAGLLRAKLLERQEDEKLIFYKFIENIFSKKHQYTEVTYEKSYSSGPLVEKSIHNDTHSEDSQVIDLDCFLRKKVKGEVKEVEGSNRIISDLIVEDLDSIEYELISVDVWDTLLRRNCHPDSVKLGTARYLYFKFYNDIKPYYRNIEVLLNMRVKNEFLIGKGRLLKGGDDEYWVYDVFQAWLNEALNFSQSELNVDEIISQLIDNELKHESLVVYPDNNIVSVLSKYKAAQVEFLSDFYYKYDALSELLDVKYSSCKVVPRNGTTSCDVGLNKRSGRLFDSLISSRNITPEKWLHIGDNHHSDYLMPRELGINAIYYQDDKEEAKSRIYRENFYARDFFKKFGENQTGTSGNDELSTQQKSMVNYGYSCAPLFLGFILKIIEEALKNKSEKIYFMTREGEFFLEIYKKMKKQPLFNLELPECEVIEVSRLSTFSASLESMTLNEMQRVWTMYSTQSMRAMFKTLGFKISEYLAFFDEYEIKLDENIQYPWLDERVQLLFENSAFIEKANEQINKNKHEVIEYFKCKGIENGSDVFLVDIGWRGSIQDNICHILPDSKITGVYLGLNTYLNEQPQNSKKIAFGHTQTC